MKQQPEFLRTETSGREAEEMRRKLESITDSAISPIDASVPREAVEHAGALIVACAGRVEDLAANRMHRDLQRAIADVSSSANHLADLAATRASAEAELAALPAYGVVQMAVAVCYIVGAAAAFFTELKLTDALVDLLGYRRDDPTGRAIGAAFAAAMLVFDLIFTKLALTMDPWSLFRTARAGSDPVSAPRIRERTWWLRATGSMALVLTLLAIAWLQVLTVIKMAPTRSIDAAYRRERRVLTAREGRIVEDSTMWFSVCVLISGGFMAAAGTKDLSLWLRRRAAERALRRLENERLHVIYGLAKTEMPVLAGQLESAGVPCAWLSTEPLDSLGDRLKEVFDPRREGHHTLKGIRAAAATEARIFEAAKRIELWRARTKPAAPRAVRSWREVVDEALLAAA